jgi:hypothetical protein
MSNTLFNYFKRKDNTDSPASPVPRKTETAASKCETPKSATPACLKAKQEPLSNKKTPAANKDTASKFKMSDKENAQVEAKMDVDNEDEIIRPVVS